MLTGATWTVRRPATAPRRGWPARPCPGPGPRAALGGPGPGGRAGAAGRARRSSSWPTTRPPAATRCWRWCGPPACRWPPRPGRAPPCASPPPRRPEPRRAAPPGRPGAGRVGGPRLIDRGPVPTYPPESPPAADSRDTSVPAAATSDSPPAARGDRPGGRRLAVALAGALAVVAALLVPRRTGAAAAPVEGIDASRYQHPGGALVDWGWVAASGKRFALIQATKGGSPSNDWFPGDWAAAGRAGLVRAPTTTPCRGCRCRPPPTTPAPSSRGPAGSTNGARRRRCSTWRSATGCPPTPSASGRRPGWTPPSSSTGRRPATTPTGTSGSTT